VRSGEKPGGGRGAASIRVEAGVPAGRAALLLGMKNLVGRRRPEGGGAGVAWALRLLAVGLGFIALLAFPSGASASTVGPGPLGTWTSWFTCTAECGGTFDHTTTITEFSPSTGAFSGTDTDGPIEGTVTGSKLFFRTVPANSYQYKLNGTIGMFGKYECWSGFAVAQNGSGTWIGSQDPDATLATLKRCTPGNWPALSDASSIATSIVSPSKAFASVRSDVVDAAITLGLALFLTFPSNVFNSTFEENYADIAAWWGKWTALLFPVGLRRALGKGLRKLKNSALAAVHLSGRSGDKKLEREQVTFLSVLVVGAFLGSLLDPGFGLNFRSVLSFVAILIAMVSGVALSGFVTGAYHRAKKHGKVPVRLEALPFGLVIAAMCVFISRVTGFEPGYLYGIICGISFTRRLGPSEEGHVVALGAWVRVALAILAWLAWAAITNDATKPGTFFGTVLVDDFLASLFVSSLVGTVISLFPLRFLPGHKLQAWHKGAWAVTFGISLFVLVQVLLRPHSTSSGPSHAPLVTTVLLFVLFAGGSLAFREHFARKHRVERALAVKVSISELGGTGISEPGGVVAGASPEGTKA
jgi:hypothetical protein